jgi:MFS family permease
MQILKNKLPFHYAWVVLGLSFVSMVAAQGLRIAFGAFVPAWEAEFGVGRATLSTLSGIGFLVYGFGQPLAGRFADEQGARRVLSIGLLIVGAGALLSSIAFNFPWLFVAYVSITSIGFAAASGVAPVSAIVRWFVAQRGLALGLIATAFAVGQLVITPIAVLAISVYGWRVTLGAFAFVLMIVLAPLAFLLIRSSPESEGMQPLGAGESHTASKKHFTMRGPNDVPNRAFWFIALPYFVCGITTSGLIDTHLVPLAYDRAISSNTTALAVGLLAAFNIAGTLISGWLSDRIPRRLILGFLYAGRASSLVMLINLQSPTLLLVFAVFFGIVDFSTVAPTTSLGTEYFGAKRGSGTIVGILSLSHQIGSALGATVTGILQQWTGSYDAPVMVAIGFLIMASALSFALPAETRQGAQVAVATD